MKELLPTAFDCNWP